MYGIAGWCPSMYHHAIFCEILFNKTSSLNGLSQHGFVCSYGHWAGYLPGSGRHRSS